MLLARELRFVSQKQQCVIEFGTLQAYDDFLVRRCRKSSHDGDKHLRALLMRTADASQTRQKRRKKQEEDLTNSELRNLYIANKAASIRGALSHAESVGAKDAFLSNKSTFSASRANLSVVALGSNERVVYQSSAGCQHND